MSCAQHFGSAIGLRPVMRSMKIQAANRRYLSSTGVGSGTVAVFDRELKSRQRLWAYYQDDSDYYDYLKKECAERICDRIDDITRSFPLALELGCHKGHLFDILNSRENIRGGKGGVGGIEKLIQCDTVHMPSATQMHTPSSDGGVANNIETEFQLVDEERLPFATNQFDIILSSLSMHWVNDLPASLVQIKHSLKPDGVFIGAMLGGNTLQELKYCLYLADMERKGGASTHISPFASAGDVAGLMQGAGFALPTVDIDTITIGYPDAFSLMEHLQRMGEGNCNLNRHLHVGKDTLLAAAAIYHQLFGLEDGTISATYQIIYFIGWSPHQSQPSACKRGSAKKSMKELQK